jgi:peptidyl-dipeptidase Dcp
MPGTPMSTNKLALLIAAGLGMAAPLAAYATTMPDTPKTDAAVAASADIKANPFYAPSPLPYQFPQFDKIHDADYMPAFLEGMKQQKAEVEAIANNPKAPTFDNTIVALEKSGQMLNRVSTVFFNLASSNTNDQIEKLQTDLSPLLSAHSDSINLNGK